MSEEFTKDFNCYSLKMSGFLMINGFVLRHMFRDKKSFRFVYVFNDSKELQEKIKDYMNRK